MNSEKNFWVIYEIRGGGVYLDGPFTQQEAVRCAYGHRSADDRAHVWERDSSGQWWFWYDWIDIPCRGKRLEESRALSFEKPTWFPELVNLK